VKLYEARDFFEMAVAREPDLLEGSFGPFGGSSTGPSLRAGRIYCPAGIALRQRVVELYQIPGVAETVRLDQVKTHYYGSHRKINPTGIVPKGPAIDLFAPTTRRIV
jgi:hypothetical protein